MSNNIIEQSFLMSGQSLFLDSGQDHAGMTLICHPRMGRPFVIPEWATPLSSPSGPPLCHPRVGPPFVIPEWAAPLSSPNGPPLCHPRVGHPFVIPEWACRGSIFLFLDSRQKIAGMTEEGFTNPQNL
jgi:hypothetical protein